MLIRKYVAWLIVGLSVVSPGLLHADAKKNDLTNVFPKRTVIYAGRAGMNAMEGVSEDNLERMCMNDPEFKRLYNEAFRRIDGFIQQKMSEEGMPKELHDAGLRLLENLWRYPAALGTIDVEIQEEEPIVNMALVCRAGKDASKMVDDLKTVLKLTGAPLEPPATDGGWYQLPLPIPVNASFGVVEDCFVVAVGDKAAGEIADGIRGKGEPLSSDAGIVAARKRMPGNDASRTTTIAVDVSAVKNVLRTALEIAPDLDIEDVDKIFGVLNSIGLDGLTTVCIETHLVDGATYTGVFCHTPNGGKGLLSTKGTKAISEDDLALIPKNAMWAVAANCDLAGGFRSIVGGVKKLDPELRNQVEGGLNVVQGMFGVTIADFLDLFGDTFILYDAPDSGGIWFTGVTMIADCKDVDKVGQHIARIMGVGAAMSEGELELNIKSLKHGQTEINYINSIGLPIPIAPAWAKMGDRVVMALYPQMVSAALDRIADSKKADSILANEEFKNGRKVIGDLGPAVSYFDTRYGLSMSYPWLLGFAQAGVAMAQKEGVDIDVTVIPSHRTVAKYVHNQVQITRTFDEGTLFGSFGAMPMGFNGMFSGGAATTALATSIMLPSLSRARELSKRTVCAANMRGLMQGMYIHAQDHDDMFPVSFQELIDANIIMRSQFVCPSTIHTPDDDLDSCYFYISGQGTNSHPANVVIYERPGNHDEDGVNVAFQDGHVDFVTLEELDRLLEETRQRLGK